MSTMMRRMLGLVMLLSLCVVVRVSADLKGDQFDRFMNINERGEPSVRSLVYYEEVQ